MAYDFGGYATRANVKCDDGRTILKDSFKHQDGKKVPLVWMHQHNEPFNVLGHAVLENREDGVYAHCSFNPTEAGQLAKVLVEHGDVTSLSIYANKLQQQRGEVRHGTIREVSLVVAGRNPGAFIDAVSHGDLPEDEGVFFFKEGIFLSHADDPAKEEPQAKESAEAEGEKSAGDETLADVFNGMNEKQQDVLCALISRAVAGEGETKTNNNDSEGGKETMKHNVFDTTDTKENSLLVHGEQEKIIGMAKNKSVGTFKNALAIYSETNTELAHGVTDQDVVELFPEYQDVRPGTPELITRDYGWVQSVIQKAHKSPMSRIRTRQSDIRGEDMRASGYQKGKQKQNTGNMKLLKRTTDPQTLVIKDSMHRDDIIDITDFDYVNYQWGIMRGLLNEEMAISIMIGDGREEGDDAKISQEHVRSIWNDDELYTIHADIDMAAARAELQGTSTAANFGENYIRAEATITAALYAREKYKGSGSVVGYCTPHELNVMLLARDLNGRRIYDSKADLAAALNVSEIYTVEQFEGKTRTTTDNKTKKLAWIFVNMADYNIGSTKGGQITQFHDFDIDFNGEKYLLETRISGALTRVYSAIALEEDVTA